MTFAGQTSARLGTGLFHAKESYSGQRMTDVQIVKSKDGEFGCTLEQISIENLELSLFGTTSAVTAGTVTAEALPTGITAGELRLLQKQFVSSVVVKDSATTPATLVANTDYKVHAEQGAIEFLNVTGFTQPCTVDYAYGAARALAMFRAPQPEVWLRFDGINDAWPVLATPVNGTVTVPAYALFHANTLDGNKHVIVDLYKIAINPTKDLSLIGDELQQFELSGKILADASKADDPALGQFGRIILPE